MTTEPIESETTQTERDVRAEKKFFRASVWTLLATGGEQGMRLGSNLILARLLIPDVFGIMTLVNTIHIGLEMLSDVGISPSIIQNKRGDEERFVNTAWTVGLIRGIAIGLLLCVAGFPAVLIYPHVPEIVYLLPLVGVCSVLWGAQSAKYFTEQRHVRMKKPVIIEISMQAVTSLTMITWAWILYRQDPSQEHARSAVWALAVSPIAGMATGVLLTHAILPGHRSRLRWDKGAAKELLTFGTWIFVSTALTFVAEQSDRLIFGALVTLAQLGIYGMAKALASLPIMLMGQLLHRGLFPVLSQAKNAGEPLAPPYRRLRVPVLIASAWMVCCLLGGGPALIEFLYPDDFHDAGWMLQILAVGAWVNSLESINHTPVLALGHPKWLAWANGAKVVGMAVFIPLGFLLGDFAGAIWGYVASEALKYGLTVVATEVLDVRAWPQDLLFTVCVVAVGGGGVLLSQLLRAEGLGPFFEGLVLFVLFTGIWGVAYRVARKRLKRNDAPAVSPPPKAPEAESRAAE
jgi:O-antigen/teichoic acid export membrane protein